MGFSLKIPAKPAPEKSDPTAKNRVWGFFGEITETSRQNATQSLQPRRENWLNTTKTASGRAYWPSRDPIRERGGINLYGMVGNDAVNAWDFLGMAEKIWFMAVSDEGYVVEYEPKKAFSNWSSGAGLSTDAPYHLSAYAYVTRGFSVATVTVKATVTEKMSRKEVKTKSTITLTCDEDTGELSIHSYTNGRPKRGIIKKGHPTEYYLESYINSKGVSKNSMILTLSPVAVGSKDGEAFNIPIGGAGEGFGFLPQLRLSDQVNGYMSDPVEVKFTCMCAEQPWYLDSNYINHGHWD